MTTTTISRRAVTRNIILGFLYSSSLVGCDFFVKKDRSELALRISELFQRPSLVDRFGSLYVLIETDLKNHTLDELSFQLGEELRINSEEIKRLSSDQLASLFSEKIRQDFSTGNVVFVRGWVLSRIEARMCAIFHLYYADIAEMTKL